MISKRINIGKREGEKKRKEKPRKKQTDTSRTRSQAAPSQMWRSNRSKRHTNKEKYKVLRQNLDKEKPIKIRATIRAAFIINKSSSHDLRADY